jgi:hypothetical protein
MPSASDATFGGVATGLSAPPLALAAATGLLLLLLLLVLLIGRLLRGGGAPTRVLAAVVAGMAVLAVIAAGLGWAGTGPGATTGSPGTAGGATDPSTAARLCAAAGELAQLRDGDAARLTALVLDGGAPHLPAATAGLPIARSVTTLATQAGGGLDGLAYPAAPELLLSLRRATAAYAAGADDLVRLYAANAAATPGDLAGVTETLADASRNVDGAAASLAALGAAGGFRCGSAGAG